jgi:hypothetical protein
MGASAYAGMFSAESVRRGKHPSAAQLTLFQGQKGVPITSVLFNLKPF